MTLLSQHTSQLQTALLNVAKSPHKKERNAILLETLNYIAKQLNLELIYVEPTDKS